jgi:hypothetical protein
MPALSPVKKESVGLGGSRMGTKESGSATKKMETYCYSEIIFS